MTAVLDLPQLERALAAHALMSVTDLAGDILYANERFCSVSGYSRAELLGRNHRLLKSGVHAPAFYADLWRTLKSGQIWDGLICNRRKNGEHYWVQSTMMPLQNQQGDTVRYLSLRTEVTRQVELRSGLEALALADADAPFSDIVQAVGAALHAQSVGIVRCAPDDAEAQVLAQWRPGLSPPPLAYRLQGTPLAVTLRNAAPTLHIIENPWRAFPDAQGFVLPTASTYYAVALRDRGGEVCGALYVQDARARAQFDTESALLMVAAVKATAAILRAADRRRLEESEARLRTLVNNAPVGVFMTDVSGAMTFVSEPLLARYGQPGLNLLGDGWRSLLSPIDAERAVNAWRTFVRGDEPRYLDEFRLRGASGEFETLRASVSPIVEHGRRIGYVGTLENISNLRDLEQRLSQAHKMEALGAFTGGIAHDFNNILASVLGYAGLTRNRLRKSAPEVLDGYLANVEAGVLRGKELIERLLAFSRSSPDTEPAQSLLAQSALKDTCELLQAVLPPTMRLDVDISPRELRIAIRAVELQQVLFNLVINARDANSVHGIIALSLVPVAVQSQICVSCGALFHGDYAEIACTDTGMGISAETLARIFEPFFTTKREHGGTGLGLAMVHGIVHRSAGHILVDSTAGQGTSVRLLFPCEMVPDALTVKDPAPTPNVATAIKARRIMLVDDERTVVEPVAEVLHGYGHAIHSYVSPMTALRDLIAEPQRYDLLICDLMMPELTGEELAAAVRRAGLRLPIVLCSGSADAQLLDRMAPLSISALLNKPVAVAELLAAIEQATAALPLL
ncbi:MAG: PAS domain S-box protein [Gammaproteobacteria bacterium]|nr:PAS domain S-box protein [Gammaproteobacteria bacterium]